MSRVVTSSPRIMIAIIDIDEKRMRIIEMATTAEEIAFLRFKFFIELK